jgi:hypothetical protein
MSSPELNAMKRELSAMVMEEQRRLEEETLRVSIL